MSAPERRIAACYAMDRGISQRRACALMRVSRSNLFYVPGLPMKNAPVVRAMHRLSEQYPRYGARRIRVFLGREGIEVGKDRCSRLWAEHGLQVPKKRSRKRIATGRVRPMAPMTANSVWSYDFVFDTQILQTCQSGHYNFATAQEFRVIIFMSNPNRKADQSVKAVAASAVQRAALEVFPPHRRAADRQ